MIVIIMTCGFYSNRILSASNKETQLNWKKKKKLEGEKCISHVIRSLGSGHNQDKLSINSVTSLKIQIPMLAS